MAKRRRTRKQPVAQVVPWYKKRWPWITGAIAVVAWVLVNGPNALANLQVLPRSVSDFTHRIVEWVRTDRDWSAEWTNEGDVAGTQHEFVTLDLFVQGDAVQGTVQTPRQLDAVPLTFLLVEGKRIDDKLDLVVFDFVAGQPKLFAKIVVRRSKLDADRISMTTSWQAFPFLPATAELWRQGESKLSEDNTASPAADSSDR